MQITIGSTATLDRLDKVYVLLNSIKANKQPSTIIDYTLFLKVSRKNDWDLCTPEQLYGYFAPLQSDTFHLHIENIDCFKYMVNTPYRDHMYFAKCLFPSFFPTDRVLFLDVDIVMMRPGIEELWESDIDGYYVGVVVDPTWQYCQAYKHDKLNTGTDNYFNAGVILFNNSYIRDSGMSAKLAHWCLNWNYRELQYICYDQTLLNYLFKDRVKLLNFKYNNTLLASLGIAMDAYDHAISTFGYLDPMDSLQHAVFVHFCGSKKPWDPLALKQPESEYPYKDEAVRLWSSLYNKYKYV